MNINIKATNTTLTPTITENVHAKLSAIEKFLQPEDRLQVELEYIANHNEGQPFRVEIMVHPHNKRAEAHGVDLYEALDLAIPKIKEQLYKDKDKRISLRRRLGAFFKRRQ